MARRITHLSSPTLRVLTDLGARLAVARGRRGITRKHMAQRAGITEFTLRRVEGGEGSVTMGAYLAVLQALGLLSDIDQVAAADLLGRDLQDAPLLQKVQRNRSAAKAPSTFNEMSKTFAKKSEAEPDDVSVITTDSIVQLMTANDQAGVEK